jgi:hypothetical protein
MKTSPTSTRHRAALLLAAALILISVAPAASAGPEVLKEAPKDGAIAYGKVVLVDDGKCAKGEIKEITGGSQQKSIARKTRCIKRPAGESQ